MFRPTSASYLPPARPMRTARPMAPAAGRALLWLACTILSGLIGGVLFLLDRKQSEMGRCPTDQAT